MTIAEFFEYGKLAHIIVAFIIVPFATFLIGYIIPRDEEN